MNNKTSDKNVAIEEDIELVKRYLENSAYKKSNSDFFKNGGWEMVDLEIPKAMANILAEREQKDKRIKELEENNRIFVLEGSRVKLELYIKENYIPKQAVIDKIKELEKLVYEIQKSETCEEYPCGEDIIYRIQIDILQELLEGEEVKNVK